MLLLLHIHHSAVGRVEMGFIAMHPGEAAARGGGGHKSFPSPRQGPSVTVWRCM